MNLVKTFDGRSVVFVLIALVVFAGCSTISRSPASSTVIGTLAFEAPASIDVKTVVEALEESYLKTFNRPVTFDDNTTPDLSAEPSGPVILQEKVVSLEGLGEVAIPAITCPGALATMHTFMPGQTGLRLIAGCVVMGARMTRIYFTDATSGELAHPGPPHENSATSHISRIGTTLLRRLPEAYALEGPEVLIQRAAEQALAPRVTKIDEHTLAEGKISNSEQDLTAHAVPVVCFAPRGKDIAVREKPGSNTVVGILHSDLIVQKENPSKNSFLHITTEEGRSGWVKRTDVRWTPCPIA